MILDIVKMIFIQLKKRSIRTFLTMVQVMLAIATIALIFNIVFNLYDGIGQMESALGGRVYQFQVGLEITDPRGNHIRPQSLISGQDIETIKNEISTIEYISPLNNTGETLINVNEEFFRLRNMAYVGPEFMNLARLSMESGMFFTQEDYNQANKVCVISNRAAQQIFPHQDPIGQTIEVYRYWRSGELPEPVSYTIVGVFDTGLVENNFSNLTANQILAPASILGAERSGLIYNQGGPISSSLIKDSQETTLSVADYTFFNVFLRIEQGRFNATQAALTAFVKDRFGQDYKIILERGDGFIQDFSQGVRYLSLVMSGFGFLIIVIGSLGILSTMMVNILERTKQIGIEKALGASSRLVFFKFSIEAIIISFTGGILGLILAYILSDYIRTAITDTLPIVLAKGLHPLAILVSLIVAIFAGWIFGMYPAYQGAKLETSEALRQN